MISVRRASTDDVEVITAVYVAGWREGFDTLYPTATFFADDFEACRRAECEAIVYGDTDTYVAELGARVVGFCDVVPRGERGVIAQVAVTLMPTLSALWVHPAAHGSGAAQTLLAHVDDEARAAGIATLGAWIPEDAPRARRLFEKTGWRPTGNVGRLAFCAGDPNRAFEYTHVLH